MAIKDKKPVTLNELSIAQNVAGIVSNEMHEERDLVNQLLGQVQMASSLSRFADVISSSKLKLIKENKLYKALDGKKGCDQEGVEIANVGTWDGFCQLLGLSRSKVDEDIQNITSFGEDTLKKLSAVGAGYRELRQFRKLPEDEKQALIEVAETGDKESFTELAESIIAKSTKEKEQLQAALENTRANYDAQVDINQEKSKALDKAKADLLKLNKRIKNMAPPEVAEELRKEATHITSSIELLVRGAFHDAFKALSEHQAESGIDHSPLMSGFLAQVRFAINDVALEFSVKDTPDDNPTPAWMREGAVEEALATINEEQGAANE